MEKIGQIHRNHPDMGYRRIRDELVYSFDLTVNDKRILRLCRIQKIQSHIKWKPKSCTRGSKSPTHLAENTLNRDFKASAPNQKWLTDVTEFKYYVGIEVHKVYLSAILDLYDHRIVAYSISEHNDLPLVITNFRKAFYKERFIKLLIHSDRGFQYTSAIFSQLLEDQQCTHSMSRVAHCTDNGPMEGFWGILKREMYYRARFTKRTDLVKSIREYIDYYNNRRIQRGLGLATPTEFNALFNAA